MALALLLVFWERHLQQAPYLICEAHSLATRANGVRTVLGHGCALEYRQAPRSEFCGFVPGLLDQRITAVF